VKRVPEVELQNDFLENDFAEILEDKNLTEAEQKRLENYYSQELEVIKCHLVPMGLLIIMPEK